MGIFEYIARLARLRQEEIDNANHDLEICNLRVQDEKKGAEELKRRLQACSLTDQERAAKLSELETMNEVLVKNLADCRNSKPQLDGVPIEVKSIIEQSYKHYPEADISYNGLYVGTDLNKRVVLDVKTWALCGQNDYQLESFLASKGIHVQEYLKQTNDFYKACDMAAMRAAEAIACKYVYDYQNYQANEYWQWAPITFQTQKGDCDDWSFLRHNAFRIAGIPEGLLRVTCGNTRYGEGHATNYYRDSGGIWRHINSTTSFSTHSSITEFPAQNDSSDQMGVTDSVWFSFNAEKAFHQFSTASAEESFKRSDNQSKLLRYIQIKPKVS